MRYTTLLIDADDTLLDFGKAEREAFDAAFCGLGLPTSDGIYSLYSAINLSLWKAYERGEIEKSEIRLRRFSRLFETLCWEGDPRDASEAYIAALSLQGQLIPGARDFLEKTCVKYGLYAVTNGIQAVQRGRFAKADINKYLKGVFISEEIGYGKPDRRYFDYVFDKVGEKDRSKILVIGDSLTSDILGAVNAGVDCAWFNVKEAVNDTEIIPTYTVKDYDGIMEIIE